MADNGGSETICLNEQEERQVESEYRLGTKAEK